MTARFKVAVMTDLEGVDPRARLALSVPFEDVLEVMKLFALTGRIV